MPSAAGKHKGTTRSLHRPERDDPRFGPRALRSQTAQCGGGREDDDPDRHHRAVPDGVGQTSAEGEQGSQRQQIGIDGPLHSRIRKTQLVLNIRGCYRHDRLIDERHGDGEDHGGKHHVPGTCAGRATGGHGGSLLAGL